MSKIIPLISSGIAGPLGILHLPRLWQKASLAAAGKDHPDYPACAPGYDTMVLNALAIPVDRFMAFLQSEKPTYPRCEAWIVEQREGSLDPETIAELNASIVGYHHKAEVRQMILNANGLPDDGAILDAINLNNLDDWLAFHQEVILG